MWHVTITHGRTAHHLARATPTLESAIVAAREALALLAPRDWCVTAEFRA